jgi:hypothetical protein
MKPSNHYIESLIKVIMECKSETGYDTFEGFIWQTNLDGDTDQDLVKALRSL